MTRLVWQRVLSSLSIAALFGAISTGASGSSGCEAVNAKGFDGWASKDQPFEKTISGFAVGDVISIHPVCRVDCGWYKVFLRLRAGNQRDVAQKAEALSYTVMGGNEDTTLTFRMWVRENSVYSSVGKCTPAGADRK